MSGFLYNETLAKRALYALECARDSDDTVGNAGHLNRVGVPANLANSLAAWAKVTVKSEREHKKNLREFNLYLVDGTGGLRGGS